MWQFKKGQPLFELEEDRVLYCSKEMVPISCSANLYPSGTHFCGARMFHGDESPEVLSSVPNNFKVGNNSLPRCVVEKCGMPETEQCWRMDLTCGKFRPSL
jgi:hypothetical protein